MLLLSVKKTITDDNTLNKERCQISSSLEHSSLRVTSWALSRSSLCYLASSVRPPRRKQIFLAMDPTCKVRKSLLQTPPWQWADGLAEQASLVLPARGSLPTMHSPFAWLPPMQPAALGTTH